MTRTKQIEKILNDLDQPLREHFSVDRCHPSFAGGHTGLAMFYGYYYKLTGKQEHLDICTDMIEKVIDCIEMIGGYGSGYDQLFFF
ncbi:MAG: hypothetical protein WDO15_06305 [Bacteroidota bacterium]